MTIYEVYRTSECPHELFNFRYNIYVSELHRPQHYACHELKVIKDPLDATGYQGVAFDKGKIVGCVRLNFVREGGIAPYDEFYDLNKLPSSEQHTASICTRYMVAKPYRKSRVPVELLKLIYGFGIQNGITSCYMDTNEPYISYYKKFGYQVLANKVHPEYGPVSIMRLDAIGCSYLKEIGSPFAAICQRFLHESVSLEPV